MQAASYAIMHNAFVKVIHASKNATPEQKARALSDIEANRSDFSSMNNALASFLAVAGDVDPVRVLEIAERVHNAFTKESK